MRVLAIAVTLGMMAATAAEAAPEPDAWLAALTARAIADARDGKPLVVEVHVPLCDNTIIRCGNAKLGDGDQPDPNLYWSTTPGFGEWFRRRGSGWTRVALAGDSGDPDVLAIHVYRRTVATPAAWRARGAPKTLEVDLVARAWRGRAIDRALAAYADDVSGKGERPVALADGTTLHAGGAAQLVAFVGHNRLMDLDAFAWPAAGAAPIGAIAIACDTAPYMKREVSAPTRVPLLMTSDLLFANAAPLEAVVLAFARGEGYATMRRDAAAAYAGVQGSTTAHVFGAFTNPSDKRW